jgi:hypothetical protein
VEGGLWKLSISLYGSSVRGTWRRKKGLWRSAPLSMEASLGNLQESSYTEGYCVEEGSGMDVSLLIGILFGNLGRGNLSGTLRIS